MWIHIGIEPMIPVCKTGVIASFTNVPKMNFLRFFNTIKILNGLYVRIAGLEPARYYYFARVSKTRMAANFITSPLVTGRTRTFPPGFRAIVPPQHFPVGLLLSVHLFEGICIMIAFSLRISLVINPFKELSPDTNFIQSTR